MGFAKNMQNQPFKKNKSYLYFSPSKRIHKKREFPEQLFIYYADVTDQVQVKAFICHSQTAFWSGDHFSDRQYFTSILV